MTVVGVGVHDCEQPFVLLGEFGFFEFGDEVGRCVVDFTVSRDLVGLLRCANDVFDEKGRFRESRW